MRYHLRGKLTLWLTCVTPHSPYWHPAASRGCNSSCSSRWNESYSLRHTLFLCNSFAHKNKWVHVHFTYIYECVFRVTSWDSRPSRHLEHPPPLWLGWSLSLSTLMEFPTNVCLGRQQKTDPLPDPLPPTRDISGAAGLGYSPAQDG